MKYIIVKTHESFGDEWPIVGSSSLICPYLAELSPKEAARVPYGYVALEVVEDPIGLLHCAAEQAAREAKLFAMKDAERAKRKKERKIALKASKIEASKKLSGLE